MPDGAPTIRAEDALRTEAAAALRDLAHAYVGHEIERDALSALRDWARRETASIERGAPRNRSLSLERARATSPLAEWQPGVVGAGFDDRAIGGPANPTGLVFETWREGDVMLADVVLGAAFEGAPGRAHGGVVAAAFDDFTGMVSGMLREPAFTGEITIRYLRPVPIEKPLRLRTWLDSRDGRKLFIHADAHAGDQLLATCKALYITVDRARFAVAPDRA